MEILMGPQDVSGIPRNVSMGKIILDRLKRFGDKICFENLETEDELRCNQVLEKSVKFGKALRDYGLKKDDVVMMISDSCFELCIPLLACLYNGFVFVALNPDYTEYELSKYIELTKPKVVFTTAAVLSKMKKLGIPEIKSMDDIKEMIERRTDCDVIGYEPEDLDDNQTAVIYFSSGTTGPPKGVQLTHRNLRMCAVQTGANYFNANVSDVMLFNLPCFNVIFLFPLCAAVVHGARVLLLSKLKPEVFLSTIERTKPTKMIFVPLLVNFVIKSPLTEKYDLSSLKHVFCGSAPIHKNTVDLFMRKFPGCVFHQIYGATETSVAILFNDMLDGKTASVGRLMANNQAKVVDMGSGKILGPGAIGELCFKGESITKGYYLNEAADLQNFDADGFLHTGDVGYYDQDRFFYIVDRIKDIIKYKSYQVSPSEIESVLLLHECVKEAAVVGIPDERSGELPAAFVVKNKDIDEQDLIDFVADHLSNYKHLHGGMRFVKEIQKNALGKIDRKVLRDIFKN